jgi:DNA-binding response OmpR family regulator
MTRERVLVVEDEPTVAEVVARYLHQAGCDVRVAHDGWAGLGIAEEFAPDVIILDLMLPGLSGSEVCRRIRATDTTPIIMLTARGSEEERIQGLQLGADDYVTKPFSPRELVARVQAVLRRAGGSLRPTQPLRFGELVLDPAARTARLGGTAVELTTREFDLLFHLASHPSQVFTRAQLLDAVWGPGFEGDEGTVTVHIRRIRAKVEADASQPRHLRTVWGVGYSFEP